MFPSLLFECIIGQLVLMHILLLIIASSFLVNTSGERLRNVEVYGASSMPSPGTAPSPSGSVTCGTYPGPSTDGAVVEMTCSQGFSAQYVVIQLKATEYLTLCEVLIYGGLQ